MNNEKNKLLLMESITKVFENGVIANHEVNFEVLPGEIHALTGENGAGKSTLMKILFGLEKMDSGKIYFKGSETNFKSPSDALESGIGMVHQHFNLVPSLTIAENIVLGNEPLKNGLIDVDEAIKVSKDLAEKYNFNLDVTKKVKEISVGQKQKVEILKSLYRDVSLLILDEPTAVLTPQETDELFRELKSMNKNDITIIFISHKLNELRELCDRITIMRRGNSMGTYYLKDVDEKQISKLMVGRDVVLNLNKKTASPKEVILKVQNLKIDDNKQNCEDEPISFTVRSGEIIGIAGVDGSGQQTIVDMISGLKDMNKDSLVTVKDTEIQGLSISERREQGLAYIPEDRNEYGTAPSMSIKENLISSLLSSGEYSKGIHLEDNKIKKCSDELISDFDIRCKNKEQHVEMLSGGNAQKVIVAREFSTNPDLLIVSQPTRGIDVGAIEFIHQKLIELRDKGCAILLVSADLNEILELSDSIIVMNNKKMTAFLPNAQLVTEEELGYYMLGVKRQTSDQLKEAFYVQKD